MRIAALFFVLMVPCLASAQTADPAALVAEGVALRRSGDDAAALTRFERAHALAPSGATLGQLGLAEHALGRWEAAAGHLDAALATTDPWVARNRVSLEQALAYVRTQLPVPAPPVELPAPRPVRVAPVRAPAPRVRLRIAPDRSLHPLAWVGVGTGTALLVGGGVAWIARESLVTDYNARCRGLGDPTAPAGCDERAAQDGAATAQTLAVVGAVSGAVLVGGSLAWMLLAPRGRERAMACVPGVGGASCVVRF